MLAVIDTGSQDLIERLNADSPLFSNFRVKALSMGGGAYSIHVKLFPFVEDGHSRQLREGRSPMRKGLDGHE
jgi:hypothetical protein